MAQIRNRWRLEWRGCSHIRTEDAIVPKWLIAGVGLLLLTTGLITFWLPIPVGVPLLFVGVPIVMKNSPTGRK